MYTKCTISLVAHELLLTLSFCAGAGVWRDGMQRHAHVRLLWGVDNKCSSKFNIFSMNIHRRLKVIPQLAKKFSLK